MSCGGLGGASGRRARGTTRRFRPAAAFLDLALMVLGIGCAAAYSRDAAPVPGPRLAVAGMPLDDSFDLRDLIGADDVLTLDVELDAAEATGPRRFDLEICLATR